MRKLTATLCLTIAVLLGSVGVSESADLQKAGTAYESGDYATALPEIERFVEHGAADIQYDLNVCGVMLQYFSVALFNNFYEFVSKKGP